MALYSYAMPAAGLRGEQLLGELQAAGLPAVDVSVTGDQVQVVTSRDLSSAEQTQTGNLVAAHVPNPERRPRLIFEIYQDIGALTGAQKVSIWGDLNAGTPPKWAQDRGPNAADNHILWLFATQVGAIQTATDRQKCQQMLIAIYTQDNPQYLVHPPFDTAIDIPGDEPIPE
ncbi:MAG TPA: hypothetical protein VKD72_28910 [Gemmataceae bacterium]|nr:hypothetical protein [Gemmataceae bacterium]